MRRNATPDTSPEKNEKKKMFSRYQDREKARISQDYRRELQLQI